MTTPIDRTAELERIYMLEPSEPSELWTEAAQSPLSPEVQAEIEAGAQAAESAHRAGMLIVLAWVGLVAIIAWFVWR